MGRKEIETDTAFNNMVGYNYVHNNNENERTKMFT